MAEQTDTARQSIARSMPAWQVRWGIAMLVLIAAAWLAFPALTRLLSLLAYPYPHDGLEGTLLYEARLLRSGQPLYQPLELYRFVSAPYPPVHYLFLALFDLANGPHVFYAGRMLSLVAALGVALCGAILVQRVSQWWPAALLCAALILSIPPLQLWGTRIKPDMLALLFTTTGLTCAAWAMRQMVGARGPGSAGHDRPLTIDQTPLLFDQHSSSDTTSSTATTSSNTPSSAALTLAAILFTLAFFTKQTALAAPLAVGLALLLSDLRDWRSTRGQSGYLWRLPIRMPTMRFSLLYLGLALGIWLLLDLVTQRQYTLHVWWSGERTAWWTVALYRKIIELLGFWWPQLLLSLFILPLAWQQRHLAIPACYLLVAPLTLFGAGEQGANHNHLLETHLALALAGSSVLGTVVRQSRTRIHAALLVLVLALTIVQGVQTTRPPDWYAGELNPTNPPERFLTFMRNTPGEILADDTGLLFQAGHDLRYDDPSTMGPAARIGAWDQRGLIDDITQKKFSAIMIRTDVEESLIDPTGRWTPEVLAAIREHYQLKFRDKIKTYVPR